MQSELINIKNEGKIKEKEKKSSRLLNKEAELMICFKLLSMDGKITKSSLIDDSKMSQLNLDVCVLIKMLKYLLGLYPPFLTLNELLEILESYEKDEGLSKNKSNGNDQDRAVLSNKVDKSPRKTSLKTMRNNVVIPRLSIKRKDFLTKNNDKSKQNFQQNLQKSFNYKSNYDSIQQLFNLIDKENKNKLSMSDLNNFILDLDLSINPSELRLVFTHSDYDNDGLISLDDFRRAMHS